MGGRSHRPPRTPSATLISARTAGVIYLAIIALGLFGESMVRASLVVPGDAATTASNILGAQALWRAGIAGDLLMHVLDVPLIVYFYLLLRPVSHPLALLATAFNIVQTCVLAANKLTLVAALVALTGNLDPGPALAWLAISLHGHGFAIGLIFFGLTCLVRAVLIVRAGYVPKPLGLLLALAGISYLVNSAALLLHPPLAAALFPAVLLPALVGELALALWLVVTNEEKLQRGRAAFGPSAASAAAMQ